MGIGRRIGLRTAVALCSVILLQLCVLPAKSSVLAGVPATAQQTSSAVAPASAKTVAPTPSTEAVTAEASKPASPKPKPQSVADTNAELQQQIGKLPLLINSGIDAGGQSAKILEHLNAILRFYRTASTALQKIGEPSDVLYQEQAQSEATQIAQLAFQGARNESMLLSKVQGAPASVATVPAGQKDMPEPPTEAQRIATLRTQLSQQLTALQEREDQLDQQIALAKPKDLPVLRQQKEQIQGGLELQKAMVNAVSKIGSTNESGGTLTGLGGDVERLQRSAPELLNVPSKPVAPPPLENLTVARDAGVTSKAVALFQLLSTKRSIEQQIAAIDELRQQANGLRTPFMKALRNTVQQGQALSQQSVDLAATPTTDQQDIANTRKQFDQLTQTFTVLSSAALPLSQEIALLEQDRGTLSAWGVAADTEYKTVLRSLLLRVMSIALALVLLFVLSQVWSRATLRYVQDVRRRRQLLLIRRITISFLTGLVVIFGFVTQFSSLATFAGFITAGIAVGLQTILLSVAAYFFIIGRYGVKVGDRITVAGVTGDVVEVGLVRFYLTELAGTGTDLHPTGRIAVFANSVLFQTGIPLYKQVPGTEYGWHTLTLKLSATANVKTVTDAVLKTVQEVYASYSARIEAQQKQVESWMGTALEAPQVQTRYQLTDSGPQLVILFPVELRNAEKADQAIAEKLASAIASDQALGSSLSGTPVIQSSIK